MPWVQEQLHILLCRNLKQMSYSEWNRNTRTRHTCTHTKEVVLKYSNFSEHRDEVTRVQKKCVHVSKTSASSRISLRYSKFNRRCNTHNRAAFSFITNLKLTLKNEGKKEEGYKKKITEKEAATRNSRRERD